MTTRILDSKKRSGLFVFRLTHLMLSGLEVAYTCTEVPLFSEGQNEMGVKGDKVMGMGTDLSWIFDFSGTVMPIFLIVMFGILAVSAGRGLLQWSRNNSSPMLTIPARIVSKRCEVKQQQAQEENGSSRTSTTYYLTYELENGNRLEFKVDGYDYGMSAEGDKGMLTYQGTRYYGFMRKPRYSTAE